jgi:hypothetical protein
MKDVPDFASVSTAGARPAVLRGYLVVRRQPSLGLGDVNKGGSAHDLCVTACERSQKRIVCVQMRQTRHCSFAHARRGDERRQRTPSVSRRQRCREPQLGRVATRGSESVERVTHQRPRQSCPH